MRRKREGQQEEQQQLEKIAASDVSHFHSHSKQMQWNFNTSSILSTSDMPLTSSTITETTTTTTTRTTADATTATLGVSSISSSTNNDTRYFDLLNQFTDLRFPHLWYPRARALRRRITLHVGPTNSGKTHAALTQLISASSGVYAAPLRLLAHEVYEKILDAGVPCDLVTGQTVIRTPLARHVACTVEMCDLSARVAVAVIDEMQLIGDPERGWAWTRALLGLQADEIHLTGDDSAIELIKALCAKMNDIVNVKYYTRLSPLVPAKYPVGTSLRTLQPGDAVITFSRRSLYELKSLIEHLNPHLKCCVVYGYACAIRCSLFFSLVLPYSIFCSTLVSIRFFVVILNNE